MSVSTPDLQELRSRLRRHGITGLSTGVLATAGTLRVQQLLGFQPAWLGAAAVGPAYTVKSAAGDNLAIHHAIKDATPGDVVVADVDGHTDVAHFGDLLALAAKTRGLGGLVINGAIRDRNAIADLEFPVFHRGTSPFGPTKKSRGQNGLNLRVGAVGISPGDLIAADADGVITVSLPDTHAVLDAAQVVLERERRIATGIREGKTTIELLNL